MRTFLTPPDPSAFKPQDVEIDSKALNRAVKRIRKAIGDRESIVVYADYDADGITAGAIIWETLYQLGAKVMPYIPHRIEEGYGLSVKGLDTVKREFNPSLIITVDHGITAKEKIDYAKKIGMEVIVTDHHVKPKVLPPGLVIHTTKLSGAGVAWFVAKELSGAHQDELLALAAIGTIADMMPLVGPNRAIVKSGLQALNKTKRVGIEALVADAGLTGGALDTYAVSHILAPRLNAMGRLEHALDALRLLCTKRTDKARELAQKLGLKNRERQKLTADTTAHAMKDLALQAPGMTFQKKLIFVVHESYNPGVIGLVAGKLVEEYWRPAIVVAKGKIYSKASARSINGFNIVEAIRTCSDILVDVGGHPLAAGFTVETKHLGELEDRLKKLAEKELVAEKLTRVLRIDMEIPLVAVSLKLWQKLQELAPFGFGNPEPVFASREVKVLETRLVGANGKHLKLRIVSSDNITMKQYNNLPLDAIAFNLGELCRKCQPDQLIDIAYTIEIDTWSGLERLQLKIRDIHARD